MLINTKDKQKARHKGIWGIRNLELFIGRWQGPLQIQNSFNKQRDSATRGESQQTWGWANRFENKLGRPYKVQGPKS